jgi:UDP-N-acetylmuramoyl-L-alanyl-D-glutamate--2,6-diaminopimelate ligase
MGRVAARSADRILLTSDNPRGEDPQRILEQVAEGLRTVEGAARRSRMIADREQAIREAISDARQDDIVLIAGKGSETIQIVGDEERPFDDREVARRTLHDLGWTEERRAGA